MKKLLSVLLILSLALTMTLAVTSCGEDPEEGGGGGGGVELVTVQTHGCSFQFPKGYQEISTVPNQTMYLTDDESVIVQWASETKTLDDDIDIGSDYKMPTAADWLAEMHRVNPADDFTDVTVSGTDRDYTVKYTHIKDPGAEYEETNYCTMRIISAISENPASNTYTVAVLSVIFSERSASRTYAGSLKFGS